MANMDSISSKCFHKTLLRLYQSFSKDSRTIMKGNLTWEKNSREAGLINATKTFTKVLITDLCNSSLLKRSNSKLKHMLQILRLFKLCLKSLRIEICFVEAQKIVNFMELIPSSSPSVFSLQDNYKMKRSWWTTLSIWKMTSYLKIPHCYLKCASFSMTKTF